MLYVYAPFSIYCSVPLVEPSTWQTSIALAHLMKCSHSMWPKENAKPHNICISLGTLRTSINVMSYITTTTTDTLTHTRTLQIYMNVVHISNVALHNIPYAGLCCCHCTSDRNQQNISNRTAAQSFMSTHHSNSHDKTAVFNAKKKNKKIIEIEKPVLVRCYRIGWAFITKLSSPLDSGKLQNKM